MTMTEEAHPTHQQNVTATGTATRAVVSVGLGGFLMLMGTISFPLPWTPVPFSMMPFGLLIVGAYQRPQWALLSVGIYLMAGGLGAAVFAGGESGWSHFGGATAGYLFGFFATTGLVSWYMSRARAVPERLATGIVAVVIAAAAAGVAAIAWMWSTGNGLAHLDDEVTASWGVGRSTLWFLLFLIAVTTTVTLWGLRRARAQEEGLFGLFLAMLASIIVMHAIGVTVLWLATPLGLMAAIILGSIVFLPFDIIKAGAAVAVTYPFLPSTPRNRET